MEAIVYKNNLYNLTKFIRRLPNAYKIIQEYSYQLGLENEQLLHNLFDELYQKRLTKIQVNKFMDICAAPGVYSKYILDKYPTATGIGISLDPKEGGHEFKISLLNGRNNRYEKIYKDIFQISTDTEELREFDGNTSTRRCIDEEEKYDLCMASCIPYNVSAKSKDEYRIIFKSLTICLNSLKQNGTLIINFTFKDMIFAINFVYLVSLLFKRIKLFKSTKLWVMQRTFYVIGYEYNKNKEVIDRINNYLKNFDDFYCEYHNKLLPDINKKTLKHILELFEKDVFLPQIRTFMILSAAMANTKSNTE